MHIENVEQCLFCKKFEEESKMYVVQETLGSEDNACCCRSCWERRIPVERDDWLICQNCGTSQSLLQPPFDGSSLESWIWTHFHCEVRGD